MKLESLEAFLLDVLHYIESPYESRFQHRRTESNHPTLVRIVSEECRSDTLCLSRGRILPGSSRSANGIPFSCRTQQGIPPRLPPSFLRYVSQAFSCESLFTLDRSCIFHQYQHRSGSRPLIPNLACPLNPLEQLDRFRISALIPAAVLPALSSGLLH